jgi:hypothetical protein
LLDEDTQPNVSIKLFLSPKRIAANEVAEANSSPLRWLDVVAESIIAGRSKWRKVFTFASGRRATGIAFGTRRAQFVLGELTVAVLVQCQERLARIGNFRRVNLAVMVGIQRRDDWRWRTMSRASRSTWPAAFFTAWRTCVSRRTISVALSHQHQCGRTERQHAEDYFRCRFHFRFFVLFVGDCHFAETSAR